MDRATSTYFMPNGSAGFNAGQLLGFRHRSRKLPRDTILGITKPAIRRLARRGGVRRISVTIYDDVREALKARLRTILKFIVLVISNAGPNRGLDARGAEGRKTITTVDVGFALNRLGWTMYGFGDSLVQPVPKMKSVMVPIDQEAWQDEAEEE